MAHVLGAEGVCGQARGEARGPVEMEVGFLGDLAASVVIDAVINGHQVYSCGDQGTSATLIGVKLCQIIASDLPRQRLARPLHHLCICAGAWARRPRRVSPSASRSTWVGMTSRTMCCRPALRHALLDRHRLLRVQPLRQA